MALGESCTPRACVSSSQGSSSSRASENWVSSDWACSSCTAQAPLRRESCSVRSLSACTDGCGDRESRRGRGHGAQPSPGSGTVPQAPSRLTCRRCRRGSGQKRSSGSEKLSRRSTSPRQCRISAESSWNRAGGGYQVLAGMGTPLQCPREPWALLQTHLLLRELQAESLSIQLHTADLLQPLSQPRHAAELRLQDLLKLQQRGRRQPGRVWMHPQGHHRESCLGTRTPSTSHGAVPQPPRPIQT